ncbi:transcription initiation factor IIE subunit beta [Lingula anatina]|uniref:Transcription initiation factor IIE subunit beta n=1 Tax=Lingula anatina TaxID=7574 RepID=A0A1S3HJJ5_LINAN|nr:transcription initiation factor IIE subunit beta [Lingula anatina]|eukprot:XP_013385626.1 transcription initiation factor IIE subunit beta [Lingula anatina]
MDPKLLKEREAFKKRAYAQPVVEKKRKAEKEKAVNKAKKKVKTKHVERPKYDVAKLNYKSASGSSQYNFSVLAKIVKFMKTRHQQGDTHPLTLEEILDEANMLDVGLKQKSWLASEALLNNPKIETVEGSKFAYKPKYNIRDKKGLLRLLEKQDLKGLGGVLYDDVEESLPKAEKAVKNLGDRIIIITRPDKKKVLFYNDKMYQFDVDEEYQQQWRSVAVEGMDERKIEDYLEKAGITSMQDMGIKRAGPIQKKKGNRKRGQFKKLNDHLDGILEDYNATESK